jgi:PAS domain S-box-containing protein
MLRTAESKLTLSFIAVLLVIGFNAVLSFINMNTVGRNRGLVEHSHQVKFELAEFLSSLKDAETGQRGYVITEKDEYLAPYTKALGDLDTHLGRLSELIKDNHDQQEKLSRLVLLKDERLTMLRAVIERRRVSLAAASQLILEGRGKQLMDDARKLVAEMELAEDNLLRIREAQSLASERGARITFVAATLSSLGLLFAVYILFSRSLIERKRSAEAIQRREEWLSTTLRGIGDAVLATDEKGRVLFLNGIAEQLTGWTQDEALGKPAKDVFHIVNEETRAEVKSPVEAVIAKGMVVGLANHTILIAKDGTERPIEDSGAPIRDANGKLIGVVLVFRDGTERRETEREREQYTQEVERLNGRLRLAVTETHHRVKNNLQLISAVIEIQMQDKQEMIPISDMLRVKQNIQALGVIHDILTSQSQEEGEHSLISVKSVLEKLIPVQQQTLGKRQLKADLEEVSLAGNKTTSLAVVANELIHNAVKHGEGNIEVKLCKENGAIVLEVCDHGNGFPEGFDPETAANTGLDLIENIARFDLQGNVAYENRDGGGARVVLTFKA